MTQTEQEMQRAVNRFYVIQKRYYNDEIDDKELADSVTQPFWQSMRLSKRRITSKGLRMDIPVWELHVKGPGKHTGRVYTNQDGTNVIGRSTRDVMVNQSFYRDNKKIYSKKEQEIASVHVLKANVQEETAACPNCGHVGKIAEYIDGCDYCGAVFTVNDFEAKISGFFLEENISQRVKKILKGAAIFCGLLLALMVILAVVSFLGIVKYALEGGDGRGMASTAITMIASLNLVPALWRTIITMLVLSAIVGVVLVCMSPRQTIGEAIVKAVIPEFSAQDFLQNLEYKLRSIHFADSAEEVAAFASCDLQKIVQQYEDVVDCNVRKLRFVDIRQDAERYYLMVVADLRLSIYNGRRIRTRQESVELQVSGKREIFLKNTLAIREYKCAGCNGSVGLLEGGVCKYCGTKLDYENYSWIIEAYEKKLRWIPTYQWIKLGVVGIFLLVFWVNLGTARMGEHSILEVYSEFSKAEEVVYEFMDDVYMPDELGLDVTLSEQKNEYLQRTYQYTATNGTEVAERYRAELMDRGYILDDDRVTENSYDIYKPVEYQGEKGYVKLTVLFDEDSLTVDLSLAEFIGEEE
ncbi:MAG: hypothetical protein IJX63_07155 [Lachnospiraceae bacterium]|nr:hypothetical protein [Lachnospiraceae bacterium]